MTLRSLITEQEPYQVTKPKDSRRGAQIHVYSDPETRRKLAELAGINRRSMSAEIQHLIDLAYQEAITKREPQ